MSVVFADSSCDISKQFLKSHGVELIDLQLNINGKNTLYKADKFDFAEYYKQLNNVVEINNFESTIKASLTEAVNTFQDVVVITPHKEFSQFYNIAIKLKLQFEMENCESKIYVIDSGQISLGYGAIVYEAGILNSTGISSNELVKKLNKLVNEYETIIVPSNINFNPINKFVYGSKLGIKPIINLKHEKFELISNVKGKAKIFNEIITRINQNAFNAADHPIAVVFGKDNIIDAEKIVNKLSESFETKVWLANYSPLIDNILGDGALLISYHKRND